MKLLKWSGLTCLLAVISIILLTSTAFAALNENVIKYRYYITTVSSMPEFKGDIVLNFERDLSKRLLISEVKKSANNYVEILNHIDTKSTYEIVIYKEFLKELKESLASKEVFPSKLNDINLNYDHIYAPVFNEFSLESDKLLEMRELPENVKLTKRVYPYLRNNFYSKGKSGKELYKLLIDGISKEEDNPIEAAYKKAEAKLNEAYTAYNEGNYSESSSLFDESITLWVKYLKLTETSNEEICYLCGMLCLMSGSAILDAGNSNQAQNIFMNAAKYFSESDDPQVWLAVTQCFIAEIYYRSEDYDSFIEWMELSKKNGINNFISNRNYAYANSAMGTKAYVMVYEYYRMKDPINTPQTEAEFRKQIISMLNWFQNLNDSTAENIYCKKITKRYQAIMAYNSIILREISFYTATENPTKGSDPGYIHIELKNHNPVEIIKPPHWAIVSSGSLPYIYATKPAAILKNNKISVELLLTNASNDPIIDIEKIIGQSNDGLVFESNKNNIVINPGYIKFILTSNEPAENRVFTYTPKIQWFLITKRGNKIPFGLTSDHKIYVLRTITLEPCYWQIVEYTCDWMQHLSASQLTEDHNVIDAIWAGCSLANLNKLQYRYQFPALEGEDNGRLPELLKNKRGKCGQWALFLRHCFYCQGIKNENTFGTGGDSISFYFIKNFTEGNNNLKCQYYKSFPFIGKKDDEKMPVFSDHALVGYGGKIVYNQYGKTYGGGELFDIVFHQRMANSSPLVYENTMVENIIDETGAIRPKNNLVQEFLLFLVKDGQIDPVPEKLRLNEVVNNE